MAEMEMRQEILKTYQVDIQTLLNTLYGIQILPVLAGRLEPEARVAPTLHPELAVVLALLPVDERVAVRGLLRRGAVRHRRPALRRRLPPTVGQDNVVRLV